MDIEEQLLRYFKEHNNADVTVDTPLVEYGVVDSMGVMELLAFIETTFDLEFDMDDLTIENFATIVDIKKLITDKRRES